MLRLRANGLHSHINAVDSPQVGGDANGMAEHHVLIWGGRCSGAPPEGRAHRYYGGDERINRPPTLSAAKLAWRSHAGQIARSFTPELIQNAATMGTVKQARNGVSRTPLDSLIAEAVALPASIGRTKSPSTRPAPICAGRVEGFDPGADACLNQQICCA